MIPQQYDHIFRIKLSSWMLYRAGYHEFFGQRELDCLQHSDRIFDASSRTVVLLAFENQYASLGGLSVVTKYLPAFLKESGEKTIFMTPYHANNAAIRRAAKAKKFEPRCSVPFECGGETRTVTCFEDVKASVPSYYLHVDNRFVAELDPYHYADPTNLLLDSLAFCAAVPHACAGLGLTNSVLFHGHDWETAAVSINSKLAVTKGVLRSAKTLLTLHNSYDSPLPKSIMRQFFGRFSSAQTVLQATIPFLSGPLTTVSTPFAHELRNDPLQRGHFTNHLLGVFSRNPPIGIENGIFGEKDPVLMRAASSSKPLASVAALKATWRNELCDILPSYHDERIVGSLKLAKKDKKVPVFFVSGRLDSMQKGFDTVFRAFSRLRRGSAKLLFSPNVGAGPENADLDFFTSAVKKLGKNAAMWPFRIPQQTYNAIVKGSSFLIMPSLYEPFGAATEGTLCGTPVVARATGGLWVQVSPVNDVFVPPFYGTLLSHISRHQDNYAPTGILYREQYPLSLAEDNWEKLFRLPLESRNKSGLYESIVDALYKGMEQAIAIFHDEKQYCGLIVNGLNSLGEFDWKYAVAKYREVYDVACRSMV